MQFGSVSPKRNVLYLRAMLHMAALGLLQLLLPIHGQIQTNLPVPARVAPNVFRIGLLELTAISESSGLAASPRYPGVFWTHNDTGEPTFLFSIDRFGKYLGSFEVKGARLIDWEAIAFDEVGNLFLADIGTNGMVRTHSAIHRVREPDATKRYGPVEVENTWYLRFPGERVDCEAFFVHDGYGYLIAKQRIGDEIRMFRFSLTDPAESILVEFFASFRVSNDVADAVLSRDKSQLALLTDEGIDVIFIGGDLETVATAPRRTSKYESPIMEGIAYADGGFLVTTEETREVLLFTDRLLSGAPVLETGLTNLTSFEGGSATFTVEVEGIPTPVFEWRFNGQLIPGATNASLILTNITLEQAGTYEVTARNPAGIVQSSAVLTVNERTIDVRITEVMSSELVGKNGTADWWELTSFDTVTNDISGWRFNDSTGGLNDAFVIPDGTVIAPGESIVFVEELTPTEFRDWWSETNVPASVQIVTYEGAALSFSAVGDQLRLWNAETTDDAAVYAQVRFGQARTGVSFTRDPVSGELVFSQLGVNGAFQAVLEPSPEIGSPGSYVTNSTESLRVQAKLSAQSVEISAAGAQGSFALEWRDDLSSGEWIHSGQVIEAKDAASVLVEQRRASPKRFYRLRKL